VVDNSTFYALEFNQNSNKLLDVCGISFFESSSGGMVAILSHLLKYLADSVSLAASCHCRRSSHNDTFS
jgi:hypothetical protein